MLLTSLVVALAGSDAGESAMLVRGARDLLREGLPSKALVQLRRARALDSAQVEIDRLMWRCRVEMGEWVPPEAGGQDVWTDVGRMELEAVPPAGFDSLFGVARGLETAEDLPSALRIYASLARRMPENAVWSRAYADAEARQEAQVASHLRSAELAARAGKLESALLEYRLAHAAKPDDPVLQAKVGNAEEAVEASILDYRKRIARCLAGGDVECALDAALRALESHPSDSGFRAQVDGLSSQRRMALDARMRSLGTLIDQGDDSRALDELLQAMTAHGGDPVLSQVLDELRVRLDRKRRSRGREALSAPFEAAIARGDAGRAETLLSEMRAGGGQAEEFDRLQARVDSVRAAANAVVPVVDEELVAARKALAAGDRKGARAALERALAKKPDHAVARSLLNSLDAGSGR